MRCFWRAAKTVIVAKLPLGRGTRRMKRREKIIMKSLVAVNREKERESEGVRQ